MTLDIYRNEEEQVAALKNWWAQNGKSLIVGVLLALTLVFAWKSWQQRVINEKSTASMLYQQMLQSALAETMTEENHSSVAFIGNKLKTEFENTQYAVFASLFLAREFVNSGDLPAAEEQLKWALAHAMGTEMAAVSSVRLAKIVAAQSRQDEALKLLEHPANQSFAAIYDEAKGDIYFAANDLDSAQKAYVSAYKESDEGSGSRALLKIKLADLGVRAEDL